MVRPTVMRGSLVVSIRSFKRRKQRRLILAGALISVGILLSVAFYALAHSPSWYRPPIIEVAARQRVRNNLVNAEQAFTENLRLGRPFVYHIYQDDLNRWLAMRKEIYPLIDEIAPPLLQDPFVVFEDARITIAGRYPIAGIDAIVSIDIDPTYRDESIVLRAGSVRCGSVPLPMGLERLRLARVTKARRGELWPGSPEMSGDLVNGFRIGVVAWWKNGGVDYRVEDLQVVPGELRLTVRPLGRHSDKASRRQASAD